MGNTLSRCLGCVGRPAVETARAKEHQVSAKFNQNTRKLKRKDVYIKVESTTTNDSSTIQTSPASADSVGHEIKAEISSAVQLALPSLSLADIKIEICDDTGLSTVLTNQGEKCQSDDDASKLLQLLEEIFRGQTKSDEGNSKAPEKSQLEHPEKPLSSIDVKAEKPQLEKVDSAGLQIASPKVVSSLALPSTVVHFTAKVDVDEVSKVNSEIKCDTVSQTIKSQKALLLVDENVSEMSTTETAPPPVGKTIVVEDTTLSVGATSANLSDDSSTSKQESEFKKHHPTS